MKKLLILQNVELELDSGRIEELENDLVSIELNNLDFETALDFYVRAQSWGATAEKRYLEIEGRRGKAVYILDLGCVYIDFALKFEGGVENLSEWKDEIVEAGYGYSHTALAKGYYAKSKFGEAFVEPYVGRFGEGFKVHRTGGTTVHGNKVTAYHEVEYWVK